MKKIFCLTIVLLFSSICLAGEWNLTGSLNQGRSEFCSVILDDGRVLVAGGYNSGELSSCEIYDQNTGQWSLTDSMNYARMNFSLTKLVNGKILATAGNGPSGSPTGTISEVFDLETETWGEITTLNFSRNHHTAILLQDGNVLVVGGDNANDYKGAEIYDPNTNEWTLTGFCIYPKLWHTLVLLPDGRVMAIGGGNSSYEHCEIYNPDTEIWTEIANLNEPRYSHTSHLLPNGNVIAIAGAPEPYRSSCEIYDFTTEEWTFADSLEIGRVGHCSELLLNDKILAIGGLSDQIGTDFTCEIYDYATNQWETATSTYCPYSNFATEILFDERVLAIKSWCEIYTWNYMPIVSQPQNPGQGTTGDILIFSVTASDPDNDSIAVRIDWGDNETSEWTELQPSDTTFELSHAWLEPGQYEVRSQTADQWYFQNPLTHNSISEWSEPLIVIISDSTSVNPVLNDSMPIISIYPNPFNDYTTISFSNQQSALNNQQFSISIFNIKGQVVKTFTIQNPKTEHQILWNGRDNNSKPVSSGVYFFKMKSGNYVSSRKIILMK